MTRSGIRAVATSLTFSCVLAGSLAANVILGWKVNALEKGFRGTPDAKLGVGSTISALNLVALDGSALRLPLSAGQTLIYVFRPGCQWCLANLPAIRELGAKATKLTIIGLSTTDKDLSVYLSRNPLPFPTYIPSNSESLATLHIVGTPQTILLSPQGLVLGVWLGIYNSKNAASLGQALHMAVPQVEADRLASKGI